MKNLIRVMQISPDISRGYIIISFERFVKVIKPIVEIAHQKRFHRFYAACKYLNQHNKGN